MEAVMCFILCSGELLWLSPLSLREGALEGRGRGNTEQLLREFVAIARCKLIKFQHNLMTDGRAFKTTTVTQKSEPKMEINKNKPSKIISL